MTKEKALCTRVQDTDKEHVKYSWKDKKKSICEVSEVLQGLVTWGSILNNFS